MHHDVGSLLSLRTNPQPLRIAPLVIHFTSTFSAYWELSDVLFLTNDMTACYMFLAFRWPPILLAMTFRVIPFAVDFGVYP